MATTETDNHSGGVKRIPQRRDTTYQFPVYRWLSWLAIAGYAIGLGCMYLIAGMFGIPAPLGWAFLVILFCVGIALLERPRQLLNFMMFYFLLMPSNRLLGLLPLPLPGFLDELFFIPFIAVIVMSLIQKQPLRGGNWFPILFGMVTLLSWYVNGKQGSFTAIKILLVNLKFFIIWYFCRLSLTFKNSHELFKWCWLFIVFTFLQFPYNILWQRAPWPRIHPDLSGGVFGPDSYAAHVIGYISCVALFLLIGWSTTRWDKLNLRRKAGVISLAIVVLYNLVFMTDTKHLLIVAPLACGGLAFLPGTALKFKLRIAFLGVVVLLAGLFYLNSQNLANYLRTLHSFRSTPKGAMFAAVTVDFPYLVHYPLFGAGPGLFASTEAVENRAPLAQRYITPYADDEARRALVGLKGTTVAASIAGSMNTDFFYITSEFGWLGEGIYLVFWIYCASTLYMKGIRARRAHSEIWGVYLALSISLGLFMMLQLLTSVSTVGCLSFPIWMLIGRIWDMPISDENRNMAVPFSESGLVEGTNAA